MIRQFYQILVVLSLSAALIPPTTSLGYGNRPGPSMVIGQNWYYNPYGQGNYGGYGQRNNGGNNRGYYGGNWGGNNTNANGRQVNGPGFSDGYGVNVDEYSAYGYGPYGYGNSNSNNYNAYGNTSSYGEGAPPSLSPYGFGGYSRFTNGW